MDLIEDDYRPEITSQSQAELVNLTKWQKDNHGEWSTIIGGWAIWSYCKDAFGSRDIDLVLPAEAEKQIEIIEKYFPSNGIDANLLDAFGEKVYYSKKIRFNDGKEDEIIFDLFYPDVPRPDNENLGITVDWKWTSMYCREQVIGENSFILIPEPELLLPLKIVAAISRMEEMRLESIPRKLRRLRSKIWKDYYDVAIMTKYLDFLEKPLKMHMNNIGLSDKLRYAFLDGYPNRHDILQKTGMNYTQIADKIPKLSFK